MKTIVANKKEEKKDVRKIKEKEIINIKKYFKEILPAIIISFTISFMLFIYEPILMYTTNMNDMWFDLHLAIKPIILIFLSFFAIISLIYVFIYCINKFLLKKIPIYKISLIISFIIFVCIYIQGNYLIKNLPPLDGSIIDYSNYAKDNIITIIVFSILSIMIIVSCIKLKIIKTIKLCTSITCVIFGMLSISLISVLLTTENVFDKKGSIPIVTKINYNNISTEKNFLIFLVDAVDSGNLKKAIENNNEFKNTFDDFTYYPDTLAAYPYTRDSIPFIFSSVWNENQTDFETYSNNSFNKSTLLNKLQENDYSINIYESGLVWNGKKEIKVDNFDISDKIKIIPFLKQEAKYILFKYLPYQFKKYSRIETINFLRCSDKFFEGANSMEEMNDNYKKNETFSYFNLTNYNEIKNNMNLNKQKKKYFQFVHTEGAHVPFDFDKEMNNIENGTYMQKVESTLTMINLYIDRLKQNNVYDNSVIIIMSDHGFFFNGIEDSNSNRIERFNPILFIKGIDEHHDMITSDKAISFEDLSDAYVDLLNDKPSTELFSDIGSERTRRAILYLWTLEDHMEELEVTGKAWDISKIKKTGREFNR